LSVRRKKFASDVRRLRRRFRGAGGLAGVKPLANHGQEFDGPDGAFVAPLGVLARLFELAVHAFQIGQDQLGHDNVAADHVDQEIHFANVAEEAVPESFAAGGSADQAGDVHKLNGGGHAPFHAGDSGKLIEAGIRHGNHAQVGLDGAEGISLGLGLPRPDQGIEER